MESSESPLSPKTLLSTRGFLLLSAGVGVLCGLLAIVFHLTLHAATPLALLGLFYDRPQEFLGQARAIPILVLLPALGGLAVGLLGDTWDRKIMGGGVEHVIDDFHHREIHPTLKRPFLKLLATVLTLSSGGSGGNEGPMAQIASGVASWVGAKLGLSRKRVRVLMVIGMASGIGALFQLPLAAMLFAGEILYRGSDLDVEALVPSGIASVLSYEVYIQGLRFLGETSLWSHRFTITPWEAEASLELLGYAVLGLGCGLLGRVWIALNRGVHEVFDELPGPIWIRPALGGLAVGVLFTLPLVLGSPEGTQALWSGEKTFYKALFQGAPSPRFLIQLLVLKLVGTSLTIGSGGSAGKFAPSLLFGGVFGVLLGSGLQGISPLLAPNPGDYALVGMAALFGGVARVPLFSILMVTEISASHTLLVPAIWASTLAFLAVGEDTLYQEQVDHIEDSPAHRQEMKANLLEDLRCGPWMSSEVITISEDADFEEIQGTLFAHRRIHKFPVVSAHGRLVGTISLNFLREFLNDHSLRDVVLAGDVCEDPPFVATPETKLAEALHFLEEGELSLLCVVEDPISERLLGVLTKHDILLAYYQELDRRSREWEEI